MFAQLLFPLQRGSPFTPTTSPCWCASFYPHQLKQGLVGCRWAVCHIGHPSQLSLTPRLLVSSSAPLQHLEPPRAKVRDPSLTHAGVHSWHGGPGVSECPIGTRLPGPESHSSSSRHQCPSPHLFSRPSRDHLPSCSGPGRGVNLNCGSTASTKGKRSLHSFSFLVQIYVPLMLVNAADDPLVHESLLSIPKSLSGECFSCCSLQHSADGRSFCPFACWPSWRCS